METPCPLCRGRGAIQQNNFRSICPQCKGADTLFKNLRPSQDSKR